MRENEEFKGDFISEFGSVSEIQNKDFAHKEWSVNGCEWGFERDLTEELSM